MKEMVSFSVNLARSSQTLEEQPNTAPAAFIWSLASGSVFNQELSLSAAFTVASVARLSASGTLDDFQCPCKKLEGETG